MRASNREFEDQLYASLDSKTKPPDSLGRIEILAAQIARVQGSLQPSADTCTLIIFAGDHGIATAGVSAYPQAVTRQMAQNFLDGGAAANVFARSVGAAVHVVDAGIAGAPIDHPGLISRRIAAGTANSINASAMTSEQCDQAVKVGGELGREAHTDVLCCGEMGIGNTSAAALVAAKILGRPVGDLVGRGTGLDDDGLARKRELLRRAAARTSNQLNAQIALAEYGGFEIAMMTGAMIGAADAGRIVIVDGYIAGAAALCARSISPGCEAAFVFAHRSAEAGHGMILEALDATPLLNLDMRLGEGTGALLAFPLVRAAAAMLREMASFDSAGISGPA